MESVEYTPFIKHDDEECKSNNIEDIISKLHTNNINNFSDELDTLGKLFTQVYSKGYFLQPVTLKKIEILLDKIETELANLEDNNFTLKKSNDINKKYTLIKKQYNVLKLYHDGINFTNGRFLILTLIVCNSIISTFLLITNFLVWLVYYLWIY